MVNQTNAFVTAMRERAQAPRIESVDKLDALLASLPWSGRWGKQVQDAMAVFDRATPWPGDVAQLEDRVCATLDRADVPAAQRPNARLALLPAY